MIDASVVICAHTLDRWAELNEAVASARAQTRPAREILVIIDHNEPLRERAFREMDGATVLANAREPGLSGGRMTGVDRAQGAVIAFLDDDAIADPNWLEELLAAYEDPNVLGAGGPVEPMWRAEPPPWFPSEFNWVIGCTYSGMAIDGGRVRNPIGASMSVRKDVIERAGGFHSEMGRQKNGFSIHGKGTTGGKADSCEETEFCIRAARLYRGGYFAYRPGARVRHAVPASRGTWKYFVQRCLVEGTAKGVLSDLAKSAEALGNEGRYVRKVLPQAFWRNLRSGDLRRASAIVAGLGITVFAFARTRLERRASL